MPLEQTDLIAIKEIIQQELAPVQRDITDIKQQLVPMQKDIVDMKKDISEMKLDVSLLAKLNQLDEIRKEPRLKTIYRNDELEA